MVLHFAVWRLPQLKKRHIAPRLSVIDTHKHLLSTVGFGVIVGVWIFFAENVLFLRDTGTYFFMLS